MEFEDISDAQMKWIAGTIIFTFILIVFKSRDFVPWLILILVYGGIIISLWSTHQTIELATAKAKAIKECAVTKAKAILDTHKNTLRIKYKQSVYQDDYGNRFFDAWNREREYFVEQVLLKNNHVHEYLIDDDEELNEAHLCVINTLIDETVNNLDNKALSHDSDEDDDDDVDVDVENMSGTEFERYCTEILKDNGWDAKTTTATGDQGVDIYATQDDITIVIQCKKYTQKIGNFAVQEIYAGKNFYDADIAAVVSNASYTKSAKQLANSTEVLLLHYSDLENLYFEIISCMDT